MKRIFVSIALFMLAAFCAAAQTATTTTPAPAPVLTYNYFAESGISYDYYGHTPASTTGFGVRIGASNAFSITDVDTTVGASAASATYATLRTGIEYVVATSGRFSFTALGIAGVTTSGSSTSSSFGGGAGLEYDLGALLSKGKFSLLVDGQFRITMAPSLAANAVRPTYGIMFRKTF